MLWLPPLGYVVAFLQEDGGDGLEQRAKQAVLGGEFATMINVGKQTV